MWPNALEYCFWSQDSDTIVYLAAHEVLEGLIYIYIFQMFEKDLGHMSLRWENSLWGQS